MTQFHIEESVVSNMCDSYIDKYGSYSSYEEALNELPEDNHICGEDGSWWDYKYSIVED